MAKARMLARSISIDKELNELSLKSQLIYTWCVPFLDDFGLLTNEIDKIKYLIFPRNSQINEGDILVFLKEAKELIEILPDCLYFKGFAKNNVITEYKKAKSEFDENRYNKGKSKYSPEIPRNPQEPPSEDKISKDKIREDNIYSLGLGINHWNKRTVWPTGTQTPQNNTVLKKLLPMCRKETEEIKTAWRKINPTEEEWDSAVKAYVLEIANRNPNNDYANHRFSFYEFTKQVNGFKKFLNK